ncbi:MAG: hypothetical protein AVDCRST_MAG39-2742 [uncultured Sphingomonadaceae bacterium]|uniref:Thioesterase domain-containing protein n=1 Tax=uncultured Sphingomonadaceae bacterium TaxID=169976 RepID=A0A6J4TIF3_9SPHN|nr:MAG: hypothetical protein AVDCRST_MAG39-2742 [uncultured Sphingomonadaceae bacterium]
MAGAVAAESGHMAGWLTWPKVKASGFSEAIGPIFWRHESGDTRCLVETTEHHRNGYGALHGGFLISCADMVLFAAAEPFLDGGTAVTSNLTCEFLGPGRAGPPLEARAEVLKGTGKLIVIRVLLAQESCSVLSFTGTLRRVPLPDSAAGDTDVSS